MFNVLLFSLFFSISIFGYNKSDIASDVLVLGSVSTPFLYGLHKNNKDILISSGVAHASTFATTQLTKFVVHRTRPDESNDNSFWSGHTAQAATSAGLMCKFKKKACLPMIGLASSVGILRYTAKKHFASDIAVGFFVGMNAGVAIPTLVFGF